MNVTQYVGSQAAGVSDTSRGPSPAIWGDFPASEIAQGLRDGYQIYDDFVLGPRVGAGSEANYSLYRGYASTGGLITDGGEIGGVIDLSSDGDDEGAALRSQSNPFQISRSHGKLWFEARLKTSTIADTKHGIFIGLMNDNVVSATVPIVAAGTMADINFVGFHRLEGDGDYFDTVYKADGVTQVTVQSDAALIAADTYVKLGFVYDPKTYVLSFYRNGVKLATTYTVASAAGTDFPNDVRLGMVMAVLNATATTPGSTKVDWWRCGQLSV